MSRIVYGVEKQGQRVTVRERIGTLSPIQIAQAIRELSPESLECLIQILMKDEEEKNDFTQRAARNASG
jgi:hypothetical protein